MARALANSENQVLNMDYLVQTIELSLDFNKQFQTERQKGEERRKQEEGGKEGGKGGRQNLPTWKSSSCQSCGRASRLSVDCG